MNNGQISFRCFQPEDIREILRIQHANLRNNLSPRERADGYLSVAFSAQQFAAMHRDIPIVVADLGAGLGGYVCGSSLECGRQVPLLSHMMGLFKETTYRNRPLEAYRTFIYGPVCIDRALRGSGLLEGLFNGLMDRLTDRFEVGTLFVSRENPRSLRAHTRHLGMHKLRSFTFNENDFFLLAFDVPERPAPAGANPPETGGNRTT